MHQEIEHNPGISYKAIVTAILIHSLLLLIALLFEIEIHFVNRDEYIDVSFQQLQPEPVRPNDEIVDEKLPISPQQIKDKPEPTIVKTEKPISKIDAETELEVSEVPYVIDSSMNVFLDSVLIANPTLVGLKTVVKERMKENAENNKPEKTQIEIARENLKEQLIFLYKDRYGDISPDKYAAQNRKNGLGVSIPFDVIVDFISELF